MTQEIIQALKTGEPIMLATIIASSGSTPASAHSKMLVRCDGTRIAGTVGGGCLEGDVMTMARQLGEQGKAEIRTFHLTEDHYVQGLICGGTVDILVEPVDKNQLELFDRLASHQQNGEDTLLVTIVQNEGSVKMKSLLALPNADEPTAIEPSLRESLRGHISEDVFTEELSIAARRTLTRRLKSPRGEVIIEPVAGIPGLIVFGGGHVSRALCHVAAGAGFRVTVVDDREAFANPVRFPLAEKTLVANPDAALRQVPFNGSTYIVIVTRGHANDEDILGRVVRSPARYIGMIGSVRKVLTTFEHLIAGGVPAELLERVHAPIGIGIGAANAEEIAVSIVAELVAVRRGVSPPYSKKSGPVKDFLRKRFAMRPMPAQSGLTPS